MGFLILIRKGIGIYGNIIPIIPNIVLSLKSTWKYSRGFSGLGSRKFANLKKKIRFSEFGSEKISNLEKSCLFFQVRIRKIC